MNNLRSFYNGLSPSFFALFSSILITSFGLLFFQQRSQESLSLLNAFTYDASMYLNMVNGLEVPGPHSCRILLPILAKLLPLGSVESILIINIISFAITFYGLIKILEKFSISRSAILFSLAIFFSTYSLAYNFTNPFLSDLAEVILQIIKNESFIKKNQKTQVFHYSNKGMISWYEFAKEIIKITKINCKVNPITSKNYPTQAKRPKIVLMNKTKISQLFSVNILGWKKSLEKCMSILSK